MPYEHRLRLIETPAPSGLETCLDMFLLHQEASRHTTRTIETYRESLTTFLEFLAERDPSTGSGRRITTPDSITADAIRRFLVHLERRGLADATVHRHARCIKTFCNFLVSEELIDASPMRKVAMPKLEKKIHPPFTREEIEALLKACKGGRNKLRDTAIVLCLLDSGLRASEFLSLTVGDIDTRDGMIRVRGKGQKERWVRLGARARKAVLKHLNERKRDTTRDAKPGESLWVGIRGPLTVSGLQQALRRLAERGGVESCYPHKFRRTFALWSARSGLGAHHLRLLLGHETLEMARRYLDMVKEDVEDAHKRASPVDKFLSKGK